MEVAKVIEQLMSRSDVFSDIMLQSDAPIMLKTPRGWVEAGVEGAPSFTDLTTFALTLDSNWEATITKGEINRPYDVQGQRLRVNVYLASAGQRVMLSMRRIPAVVPSLSDAGLPPSLRALLENPSGLILVSGPTGSGKTTTMAAMVDTINKIRNAHVVTVEDPIEYVFKRERAIFSQREVGVDCDTFLDGVRAALRQRPDVIVIGEIRDRETAEQAFIAGESGHLVIGTLHASSAPGTVGKMLSFFSDSEREARTASLASCLLGVVNQTLIPRVDGNGYALAVDFMANHKRTYSKVLGEPEKLQGLLTRSEDQVSIPLGNSAQALLKSNVVSRTDVLKSLVSNPIAYEAVVRA